MASLNSHGTGSSLTLRAYVRRRNGVPLGAPGSLSNMLYRAFGARSFDAFWQHWNPIFGYYLGRYVFVPSKRIMPVSLALLVTFVFTGVIHDLVTMAVRRDVAFLFTPWFLFLGTGVVIAKLTKMDLASTAWPLRAAANTAYLGASLALAVTVFDVT